MKPKSNVKSKRTSERGSRSRLKERDEKYTRPTAIEKESRVENMGDFSKSDTKHGHNDLSWLTFNSNLAHVVSRFPFGRPLGYGVGMHQHSITSGGVYSEVEEPWSIPGVVAIKGLYTAGRADGVDDPINYAALGVWVKLRHAGTGSLVDDPNDVACYFIAISQLLAFLGWLRRVTAELTATNPLNLYARRGLLLAEGLDYEDFKSHYAELVTYTTWFATQVNNFIFPKLPFFENAYTQFHYVYKDENLAKGQMYIYSPYQFGVLDEVSNPAGSDIPYGFMDSGATPAFDPAEYIDAASPIPFRQVKAMGDYMLSVLINSVYVATLGAAILKAYGTEGLFRVSDIDMLDERLDITMDAEIAMQFHNLSFYDSIDGGQAFSYTSVVPAIPTQQSPYIVTPSNFYKQVLISTPGSGSSYVKVIDNLLDCFSDQPESAEILLASRHTQAKHIETDGSNIVRVIEAHDVFLPQNISVFYYDRLRVLTFDKISSDLLIQSGTNAFTSVYGYINLTTFTASPLCQMIAINGAMATIGEFHNAIQVESTYLRDIYRSNIMSLFQIPMFK